MIPKRHFDLESLRALVAIVDSASFSRAAEQMGRTQSAVSLQIKRLEALVGRPLLDRLQGRVLGPTAEGRLLVDYARRILRLNDEAYASLAEAPLVATLRVGLPEDLMESLFPAVLRRALERHPRLQIIPRTDLSAPLLAEIEAGRLDLALIREAATEASGDTVLWQEPLCWMAGEGFERDPSAPLPLALFGDGCAFRLAATQALAQAGIAWEPAFRGHSYTGLRHALACGLGVSALPMSLLATGLKVVDEGLPPLPDTRVVARFPRGGAGVGGAKLLEVLKEQRWARGNALSGAAAPDASALLVRR